MEISEERAKRLGELLCDATIQLEELLKRYPLGENVQELIAELSANFTLKGKPDGYPILKEEVKEDDKS